MKKVYITPEALTVVLGTCQMMAESLPLGGGTSTIENPNEILTKEDKYSGKNIWDEEW